MNLSASLRSRRLAARRSEATEQLIAFRLRQDWFALPIQAVQKVVPLGKVYSDPTGAGLNLTTYQNREFLVIDVSRRIFNTNKLKVAATEQRYLLILQSETPNSIGLPIDSAPTLRRVPKTAFKELPEDYKTQKNIRCVSSMTVQENEQIPLFLLDPKQLNLSSPLQPVDPAILIKPS